jgi:hypothetical protein
VSEVRLDEHAFLQEVERIVHRADAQKIPLRAIGSVGIYYRIRHSPHARGIYLHRHGVAHDGTPRFKDLDLASLEKHSSAIYKLFVKEFGFSEDREANALFGMYRNVYFHPAFTIDVFYDSLRFSHEIPLKGRLPEGVTLAPEDLLLGKTQIHASTPPDLADIAALLTGVPIGYMDREYLASFLGDDWGLWYDARTNLARTVHGLSEWQPNDRGLTEENLALARERVREAVTFLDTLPKSRRWEKRARRGTQDPWFEEVDEIR